jgi:hypothetical protein
MILNRNINEKDHISIIAPGRNKTSISWHTVKDLEELSFPTIY